MIYLDNASTTQPSAAACAAARTAMEQFGNPSSMHRLGLEAEKLVKNARRSVAGVLGVTPEEVYFTSGGTEANNTAILGYCRRNKRRGRHVITTKIEHPSVSEPFEVLKAEGFEVTYIGVGQDGTADLSQLEAELRPDTIFVSCMWVNNETGCIQPVEKIKEIMKRHAPSAALHVDAVQAFGKIECKPKKHGIDLLSVSAHKIHGLKGTGALYVGNVNTAPYLIGGGQQKGMRSGTENVVGIAAFGAACEELSAEDFSKTEKLKKRLSDGILENIDRVKINGGGKMSPYILNVSFLGIKAEILLHALEPHGIFVSTGSACSTNKPMPSSVLTAMGCKREEIMGAVRFSFGAELDESDIDFAAECLKKEVSQIRKYMR